MQTSLGKHKYRNPTFGGPSLISGVGFQITRPVPAGPGSPDDPIARFFGRSLFCTVAAAEQTLYPAEDLVQPGQAHQLLHTRTQVDEFQIAPTSSRIGPQIEERAQAGAVDEAHVGQVQHDTVCDRYAFPARDGNDMVADFRVKHFRGTRGDLAIAIDDRFFRFFLQTQLQPVGSKCSTCQNCLLKDRNSPKHIVTFQPENVTTWRELNFYYVKEEVVGGAAGFKEETLSTLSSKKDKSASVENEGRGTRPISRPVPARR